MKIEDLKEWSLYHPNLYGYYDTNPEALFLLEGSDVFNTSDIPAIKTTVENNLPLNDKILFDSNCTDFYNYDDIIVSLSGRMARITVKYSITIKYTSGTAVQQPHRTTTFYMCRNNGEWHVL